MILCSFTHSVLGSTIIITVTGFSSAIGQWAPFSLVSLSSLRVVQFIFQLFTCQLGEAILTERVPQSESVAICLVDTRSPKPRTVEDQEREFLVSGRDSDDEDYNDNDDEDEDEEAKRQEKNRILTYPGPGAQVGRMDLTEVDKDDEYEVVHHDTDLRQSRRPRFASGRHGHEGGTLSSKAGIILVRTFFAPWSVYQSVSRVSKTSSSSFLNSSSRVLLPFSSPLSILRSLCSLVIVHLPIPALRPTSRWLRMLLIRTVLFICFGMYLFQHFIKLGFMKFVAFSFSVGGVAAFFAFILTWRLARELRHR